MKRRGLKKPFRAPRMIRVSRSTGSDSRACTAPSILEFDADGKLLKAWGGPSDPGFIGGKCKEEAGCIWPQSEHGIYVDQKDNVWISGNSGGARKGDMPWSTKTC